MNDVGAPLAAWLTWLESLSVREIDLGLERVEQVLERLQLRLPAQVLHVAGTNGKGSCVAMLESILRATGRTIGCYTSPHVFRYNERIRVDGTDARDEIIIAAFERIEAVRDDIPLTYFEYGTLAALVVFVDHGVEIAILEVGMGGRLDAVNAVEPQAGLITNVSLDHCDWLGEDIESIAFEKAGIMRAGKPTVFGDRVAPSAITAKAADVGAELILAGRDYDWSADGSGWQWRGVSHQLADLELPVLPGANQLGTAAAVLALLEAAGFRELLRPGRINDALTALRLDGRMQRLDRDPRWLFDVAHNPAAATALAAALRADPAPGRTIAILGLLDDKDVAGVLAPLVPVVDQWIAVTADSPRAVPAAKIAGQVAEVAGSECTVAPTIAAAITAATNLAGADDRILVTGSFYLVGPMISELYSRRTQ